MQIRSLRYFVVRLSVTESPPYAEMPREGADDEADPVSTAHVEAGASDYVIGGENSVAQHAPMITCPDSHSWISHQTALHGFTGAASDSGRRNERPGSTDQDQADELGEIADLGTSRHALMGHRRRASQSSLSQGSECSNLKSCEVDIMGPSPSHPLITPSVV